MPSTSAFLGISRYYTIFQLRYFTMSNQALFCSSSKVNREIFKNYSDILMEQQALRLCHYYQVVCFLLFLSYTQNIYLLLSFCHLIITSITIFIHVIIQFISILIPQTCCCRRSCPSTITDYTSTYQNFLQCIVNKCVIDWSSVSIISACNIYFSIYNIYASV